ncbi:nickel pincer cofactor biosynthesis protein LarB [Selenomonadales bacterium OttesenSCG-928-I06]|nr:nickel pincer cofactor biosynthesis protein LarB [Selenomonadales bacterium OttesenSCG-928-I06]
MDKLTLKSERETALYEDLGFAKVDHSRYSRQGFNEVVFGAGKTTEQVVQILKSLSSSDKNIMATRVGLDTYKEVLKEIPEAKYYELARIISIEKEEIKDQDKFILVLAAGTSDINVAEEAAVTAEIMGNKVERAYDVGVAGIHRLFDQYEKMQEANVVITVAGMEGALTSVVAGLVSKPVISVPTSVGYGASFEGLTALLAMMNSCAKGVAVVNIDNGFGAGHLASIINKMNI